MPRLDVDQGIAKGLRINNLYKLVLVICEESAMTLRCKMHQLSDGFGESTSHFLWKWTSACEDNGRQRSRVIWVGVESRR